MGKIIYPLHCFSLFMVQTEFIRLKKKFCGNKAKPLVNVFDFKLPELPLPLIKSYILKCGIDECVWKFMVQNRGGWQNLLRFVKKYSYPTLYINTVFSFPFFLSASIHPGTKSIYTNISSSFGDRQWSFLASVCDKIVDSLSLNYIIAV